MPLAESEAIILGTRPFGEAHKVVSFLSRRFGRMRGVAPHARRSQQRFGGALEPLSHVHLWFFERTQRELVRLSESELMEAFWDARGELERSVALNELVELSELLLPEREPAEKAFRLLLATLRAFNRSDSVWLPLTYFQLWSARLAGWLPALDRCSHCQRLLADEAGYASPALGQMVCGQCRRAGMRLLTAASRQAAVEMLAHPLSKLCAEGWKRERATELSNYLLDILEYHSERKLITRELLHEKA